MFGGPPRTWHKKFLLTEDFLSDAASQTLWLGRQHPPPLGAPVEEGAGPPLERVVVGGAAMVPGTQTATPQPTNPRPHPPSSETDQNQRTETKTGATIFELFKERGDRGQKPIYSFWTNILVRLGQEHFRKQVKFRLTTTGRA